MLESCTAVLLMDDEVYTIYWHFFVPFHSKPKEANPIYLCTSDILTRLI